MARIACKLVVHSVSEHLQQLFTGFRLLHDRGLIRLTQDTRKVPMFDRSKPQHLQNARQAHVRVLIDGRVQAHYDTHDSWEVDEEFLAEADVYFKRSYAPSRLSNLSTYAERIQPLGLNYLVVPDGLDPQGLHRSFVLSSGRERVLGLAQSFGVLDSLRFAPRVRYLESLPDYDTRPRVLFMVRAWDPAEQPSARNEKVEERREINEMRAECVRLLRDEFGDDFYGGFMHTDFAVTHYPDVLLPDRDQATKRRYLDRVRRHPICVATTGLHGSIGWKFAEYLALSRAIVSERLQYEAPGRLSEGVHYLPFETPQACISQVKRLFSDRGLRRDLMRNAAAYYQSHLRPDALVLHTILRALA